MKFFSSFFVSMVLFGCIIFGGTLSFAGMDKLDLNTATTEQLITLPGIGPELAQRILDYKKEHGPFKSVDELTNVKGVGKVKLTKLRDAVTIGGFVESHHISEMDLN